MYSHARLASWRMTIRSPWPNVAYGTHKRSSRNRKGGSLAFTLPEPRRSTRWKCCQPLSPTCDCSRNIATPCYRLRGVGNRRSAGIVRLRHHGPRIRAMNRSSVGVSSSFRKNAAICLQRRCRPDCKSHLAIDTHRSGRFRTAASLPCEQRLNRCDVHFAAALTGGAFAMQPTRL